jgi:sigma-E factor negative regulatory protein RseA
MMNDKNREWLSALVDGELRGQELEHSLNALRNDPELQASWKAYHVVRDTVSSNLNDSVDLQLHRRISTALESEPTILAPQRRARPWLKQVAGVAIAASVTGVAIIGLQGMNGVDSNPVAVPVAQQQEYLRIEPTLVAQGNKDKEKAAQNSDALNAYLVNHNEYSANSGIQGVLPYVRIVGHKVGQ